MKRVRCQNISGWRASGCLLSLCLDICFPAAERPDWYAKGDIGGTRGWPAAAYRLIPTLCTKSMELFIYFRVASTGSHCWRLPMPCCVCVAALGRVSGRVRHQRRDTPLDPAMLLGRCGLGREGDYFSPLNVLLRVMRVCKQILQVSGESPHCCDTGL